MSVAGRCDRFLGAAIPPPTGDVTAQRQEGTGLPI
jgi:hypothetical protein